jgi:FkbM family methyltransferase
VRTFIQLIGNAAYKSAFPVYRPVYTTYKRFADRFERGLLRCNIAPGATVVDAGANIGIYSRFLADLVGLTGRVHSFEPDPENFQHLFTYLHHCHNIQLNHMAVGSHTGEISLYVSEHLNVDHRTYPTETHTHHPLSVQSIRLDDYFIPGSRVDLIKMDIQGYELHALDGAARILQDNPGVKLLLEFWPYGLKNAGRSAEELLRFLTEKQFELLTLCQGRTEALSYPINSDSGPSEYFNIFARPISKS